MTQETALMPWWHSHGSKISVKEMIHPTTAILAGSAAELKINRHVGHYGNGYLLSWSINHANGQVNGQTFLKKLDLESAFDLIDHNQTDDRFLIDRFGASSAKQGKYIRWRNLLNIPGPGTGLDGDPNISIEITPDIKDTVRYIICMG